MNTFCITEVIKEKNKISYRYNIEGEWKKYFRDETLFWAEYDKECVNLPNSIAVLPLVGNVIVLASLFDAAIYVDEIDQEFYDCVDKFLEGYQTISPQINYKKNLIIAKQLVLNSYQDNDSKSMLFFSGGVDAWSSLITHMEEKPTLISIWGADIPFDNEKAWGNAKSINKEIAEIHDLEFMTVRSTLRRFIDEKALNELSMKLVKDNWWSAFQHSVGMMCLAAPYAIEGYAKLHFASTYSVKDEKSNYVIASDPLIDNQVAFAGCKVNHDGYEYSRHDKVLRICNYAKSEKIEIKIRACFKSSIGDNCCKCEKCSNTIFSMLIGGFQPAEYGFTYDEERMPEYISAGMQEMAKDEKFSFLSIYSQIQIEYRKKYKIEEVPEELRLFYLADIHHLADFLEAPCNTCKSKDDKLNYLDEVIEGKEWLEKQYHSASGRVVELENNWKIQNEWIDKLNQDILWLKEENSKLSNKK